MTDRVEWVQFMNFDFLERIPLREALRHKTVYSQNASSVAASRLSEHCDQLLITLPVAVCT